MCFQSQIIDDDYGRVLMNAAANGGELSSRPVAQSLSRPAIHSS